MPIFTRDKTDEVAKNGAAKGSGKAKSKPDKFAMAWQVAWNSLDPGQIIELCSEDVVWADPMTLEPARGHAAVRIYLEELWQTFPDMNFTYPESAYSADGDRRLALHWRVTATMLGVLDPPGFAPTGKRLTSDGVDLLALRDGKVEWYQGFFDRQGALDQLGLVPAAGSRSEKVAVRLQRALAKLPG